MTSLEQRVIEHLENVKKLIRELSIAAVARFRQDEGSLTIPPADMRTDFMINPGALNIEISRILGENASSEDENEVKQP